MEFLIFFGAAIILVSAAYIITTIMAKRNGQGVPNWPATDGAIIRQALYRHTKHTEAGETTTYTPTLEYTYTVDQTTYHGHKHPAFGTSFSDRQAAEALMARYPEGKRLRSTTTPTRQVKRASRCPAPTITTLLSG